MGMPLNRLIVSPTPALSLLHCCWNGYDLVWISVFGVCAVTFPELYLGTVTFAEGSPAFQCLTFLSNSDHPSPPLPSGRTAAPPAPSVILLVFSSSLLTKTHKEILNSPGGRTSGIWSSQLEKWSPDNYLWLWYFNLCSLCMVTLFAAPGTCNLDIF